jgi:hypothetical protein
MTEEGFRERLDQSKRLADLRSGTDKPAVAKGGGSPEVAEEDQPAFSILSADRQQKVMLELRFTTGNARAFAYSYLVGVQFDRSAGITLDFSGYEVRITGRNLDPLFAGLVSQRVAVVNEMDDLQAEARHSEDETVVTGIQVSERG